MNEATGTPFIGYASLVSAAAVTFSLFTDMGSAAYTLQANERLYITNITISSGDTGVTPQLVTIDTGTVIAVTNPTPTKLVSAYVNSGKPLQPIQAEPGSLRTIFGIVPRAFAAAVTAGSVEIIIKGFISKT